MQAKGPFGNAEDFSFCLLKFSLAPALPRNPWLTLC